MDERKKDLEDTQDGIDFLIDNDLAYMKGDQVSYRTILSYTVYIDSDGAFSSYGEDESTKY